MKKQTNKKRVFAFLAVLLVLVTVLCVPAFADATQVGTENYTSATSLSTYFGTNYVDYQGINPYTFCIDVGKLCAFIVEYKEDFAYRDMYLDLQFEFSNSTTVVVLSMDTFDYTLNDGLAWTIYIDDNAVLELTMTDAENFGSQGEELYYLIPFYSIDVANVQPLQDIGFVGNRAPYSIINNQQLSNTGTFRNGYDIGFNTGRQVGQEEGFQQGYDQSSADQGIASAGAQLITSVVEAPVNVFTRMLNFEIFGVNVLGFVVAILSFALVIAILKKVV